MSTGRELERTVTCGFWKEYIAASPNFVRVELFDAKKERITPEQALTRTFCSMKVFFKRSMDAEAARIVSAFIKSIADGRSESMALDLKKTPKHWMVVIS